MIGELSSVWPCVVIRGDVNWIRIGARTNIQDGSVLHVMQGHASAGAGRQVTVGHGAILHGCTIESRVLIGMGAILLNGVRVGEGSIIAAGTLVPEGTVVPPGSLFMGHPGKFRRALTPEDQASDRGVRCAVRRILGDVQGGGWEGLRKVKSFNTEDTEVKRTEGTETKR